MIFQHNYWARLSNKMASFELNIMAHNQPTYYLKRKLYSSGDNSF